MSNIDTLKLLGSLLGNGAVSSGSGANILQSVLGAAMGGGQGQQAGLGGLLGSVLGAAQGQQVQANVNQQHANQQGGGLLELLSSSGLGGLLGAAMGQYSQAQQNQPQAARTPQLPQGVSHAQASDQATLLIRAMLNAAKSDGQFDQQEQQKILSKLGDLSQDEANFIRHELSQPLDVNAFAKSIPRGLEQQVYAISLMAINLDSNPEAQYLHHLAQGLGISPQLSNQIHQQLGAPKLYS
jgi:uncharacterized membrane protein YebE (DUF533 family)